MKKATRNAKAYNIRYSDDEQLLVTAKALAAGVTPTEWIRSASLERRPPVRKNVPEINRQAWLVLGEIVMTINTKIWDYSKDDLRESLAVLRAEITKVRMELLGKSSGEISE